VLTVDFNLLGIKGGERVLDAGSGTGRHSWMVCKQINCSVYAIDIDEDDIEGARWVLDVMDQKGESIGDWHVIKGDVIHLPFEDASFDRVICSEVLEHLPNDQQAVRELIRVLKEDGAMAISVPTYLTEAIYWKISKDYSHPGGHIRKYKRRDIINLLQKNNLTIYAIRYKHAFHSIYWFLRCLFGINNEKAPIPSLYYRFLEWDIDTKHKPLRLAEDFLNLFFPKSIVLYVKR
jgi:ubiquinone/menaquinone biosynthesis C-methylase UbiE